MNEESLEFRKYFVEIRHNKISAHVVQGNYLECRARSTLY